MPPRRPREEDPADATTTAAAHAAGAAVTAPLRPLPTRAQAFLAAHAVSAPVAGADADSPPSRDLLDACCSGATTSPSAQSWIRQPTTHVMAQPLGVLLATPTTQSAWLRGLIAHVAADMGSADTLHPGSVVTLLTVPPSPPARTAANKRDADGNKPRGTERCASKCVVAGLCVARLLPDRDVRDATTGQRVAKRGHFCGIQLLWTAAPHRRRGYAAALADAARAHLGRGLAAGGVPRARCAFSTPTPAGAAFAARYSETEAFGTFIQ